VFFLDFGSEACKICRTVNFDEEIFENFGSYHDQCPDQWLSTGTSGRFDLARQSLQNGVDAPDHQRRRTSKT